MTATPSILQPETLQYLLTPLRVLALPAFVMALIGCFTFAIASWRDTKYKNLGEGLTSGDSVKYLCLSMIPAIIETWLYSKAMTVSPLVPLSRSEIYWILVYLFLNCILFSLLLLLALLSHNEFQQDNGFQACTHSKIIMYITLPIATMMAFGLIVFFAIIVGQVF